MIGKYQLNFLEQDLSEAFEKRRENAQRKSNYISGGSLLLLQIVLAIRLTVFHNATFHVIVLSLALSVLALILNQHAQQVSTALIFVQFVLLHVQFASSEYQSFIESLVDDRKAELFLIGLGYGNFSNIVLQAFSKWYVRSLCLWISFMLGFAWNSSSIGDKLSYLIPLYLTAIASIAAFYFQEKFDKENFYILYIQNKSLIDWQRIIKDNIPQSMVFVTKQQIKKASAIGSAGGGSQGSNGIFSLLGVGGHGVGTGGAGGCFGANGSSQCSEELPIRRLGPNSLERLDRDESSSSTSGGLVFNFVNKRFFDQFKIKDWIEKQRNTINEDGTYLSKPSLTEMISKGDALKDSLTISGSPLHQILFNNIFKNIRVSKADTTLSDDEGVAAAAAGENDLSREESDSKQESTLSLMEYLKTFIEEQRSQNQQQMVVAAAASSRNKGNSVPLRDSIPDLSAGGATASPAADLPNRPANEHPVKVLSCYYRPSTPSFVLDDLSALEVIQQAARGQQQTNALGANAFSSNMKVNGVDQLQKLRQSAAANGGGTFAVLQTETEHLVHRSGAGGTAYHGSGVAAAPPSALSGAQAGSAAVAAASAAQSGKNGRNAVQSEQNQFQRKISIEQRVQQYQMEQQQHASKQSHIKSNGGSKQLKDKEIQQQQPLTTNRDDTIFTHMISSPRFRTHNTKENQDMHTLEDRLASQNPKGSFLVDIDTDRGAADYENILEVGGAKKDGRAILKPHDQMLIDLDDYDEEEEEDKQPVKLRLGLAAEQATKKAKLESDNELKAMHTLGENSNDGDSNTSSLRKKAFTGNFLKQLSSSKEVPSQTSNNNSHKPSTFCTDEKKQNQQQLQQQQLQQLQQKKGEQQNQRGGGGRQKHEEEVEAEDDGSSNEMFFDTQMVSCVWGDQEGVLLIMNDVSLKIMNEKLREIERFKDQMLSTVTHDLKTPLNSIIMILENSIEMGELNEKQRKIILQNSHLLMSLINDILDYSQIQRNKFRLIIEELDLQQLVLDVVDLFEIQAEQKRIQLRASFKNIQQSILHQDERRIKQILVNLIGNAMKFTQREGSINVVVKQKEPHCIQIAIKDTGTGISDQIQKKLFKFFNTFDHSERVNNRHGIGLGLAICKQLNSQLGPWREIKLKSEVGKGSKFTFCMFVNLLNHEDGIEDPMLIQEDPQYPITATAAAAAFDAFGNNNFLFADHQSEFLEGGSTFNVNNGGLISNNSRQAVTAGEVEMIGGSTVGLGVTTTTTKRLAIARSATTTDFITGQTRTTTTTVMAGAAVKGQQQHHQQYEKNLPKQNSSFNNPQLTITSENIPMTPAGSAATAAGMFHHHLHPVKTIMTKASTKLTTPQRSRKNSQNRNSDQFRQMSPALGPQYPSNNVNAAAAAGPATSQIIEISYPYKAKDSPQHMFKKPLTQQISMQTSAFLKMQESSILGASNMIKRDRIKDFTVIKGYNNNNANSNSDKNNNNNNNTSNTNTNNNNYTYTNNNNSSSSNNYSTNQPLQHHYAHQQPVSLRDMRVYVSGGASQQSLKNPATSTILVNAAAATGKSGANGQSVTTSSIGGLSTAHKEKRMMYVKANTYTNPTTKPGEKKSNSIILPPYSPSAPIPSKAYLSSQEIKVDGLNSMIAKKIQDGTVSYTDTSKIKTLQVSQALSSYGIIRMNSINQVSTQYQQGGFMNPKSQQAIPSGAGTATTTTNTTAAGGAAAAYYPQAMFSQHQYMQQPQLSIGWLQSQKSMRNATPLLNMIESVAMTDQEQDCFNQETPLNKQIEQRKKQLEKKNEMFVEVNAKSSLSVSNSNHLTSHYRSSGALEESQDELKSENFREIEEFNRRNRKRAVNELCFPDPIHSEGEDDTSNKEGNNENNHAQDNDDVNKSEEININSGATRLHRNNNNQFSHSPTDNRRKSMNSQEKAQGGGVITAEVVQGTPVNAALQHKISDIPEGDLLLEKDSDPSSDNQKESGGQLKLTLIDSNGETDDKMIHQSNVQSESQQDVVGDQQQMQPNPLSFQQLQEQQQRPPIPIQLQAQPQQPQQSGQNQQHPGQSDEGRDRAQLDRRALGAALQNLLGDYSSAMIADDNTFNCLCLEQILIKNKDLVITQSYNGQEALESYKKHRQQIIFMDLNMPILDGYECLKEIRDFEAENHIENPTKIIVVSAQEFEDYFCHFDGFISKPIKIIDIVNTLHAFRQNHLDQQQLLQQEQ